MSNEHSSRRPVGKSSGGAPMGSTISIVVAVVAVIMGFLILKNITSDNSGKSAGTPSETTNPINVVDPNATTIPLETTTTAPAMVYTGATVIVANASGVQGTAGQFSKALGQVGFTMATPTNAAGAEAKLATSKVYFLPGGELVAASVAKSMGGVAFSALPTPVPVKGEAAGIGEATVVVMLGSDLAGKALPALAGDPVSTTVPPVTGLGTTTTVA
ncbi:MAG: LytR C-terminal domain-containing protein [Actinomycetota bacterium]